jgi:hypothetical protein
METPAIQTTGPANNAQIDGVATHASLRQDEIAFASVLNQETQKAASSGDRDRATPHEKSKKKDSRPEKCGTSGQAQANPKAVSDIAWAANPAVDATDQHGDIAGDSPLGVPGVTDQGFIDISSKIDASELNLSVEPGKSSNNAKVGGPTKEADAVVSAGAAPETAELSLEGLQTIGVPDTPAVRDGKNEGRAASDSSQQKLSTLSGEASESQNSDHTRVSTSPSAATANSAQGTQQPGDKAFSSTAPGDVAALPDAADALSVFSMQAAIDAKSAVRSERSAEALAQQTGAGPHLTAESTPAGHKPIPQKDPLVTPIGSSAGTSTANGSRQSDDAVIASSTGDAYLASSASVQTSSEPREPSRAKEDPASADNGKRGLAADHAISPQPVVSPVTPPTQPAAATFAGDPGEGSDDHEAAQARVATERPAVGKSIENHSSLQASFAESTPRPETGTRSGSSPQSPNTAASAEAGNTVPAVETQGMHIGRIVNSAKLSEQIGQAEMQVKLQSDALGPISLHATLHDNQVGAAIRVEGHETHAILAAELPALERALSEKNLRVESISILPGSVSSETNQGASRDPSQGQYSEPRPTPYHWSPGQGEHSSLEVPVEAWYLDHYSTRLNVRA